MCEMTCIATNLGHMCIMLSFSDFFATSDVLVVSIFYTNIPIWPPTFLCLVRWCLQIMGLFLIYEKFQVIYISLILPRKSFRMKLQANLNLKTLKYSSIFIIYLRHKNQFTSVHAIKNVKTLIYHLWVIHTFYNPTWYFFLPSWHIVITIWLWCYNC